MSPSAPRPFLADILEEHLEEIEFLHGRWCHAVDAADWLPGEVAWLEERILAHLSGIPAAGEGARPMLEAWLMEDDPAMCFAGARGLLELDREHAKVVVEAMEEAAGDRLEALGSALSTAAITGSAQSRLHELLSSASPSLAVSAGLVLAHHGSFRIARDRLDSLLDGADESVRLGAWKLVAWSGAVPDARLFAAALRDDAPAVRLAALEAGAWCRVPGSLPAARHLLSAEGTGTVEVAEILGVIGGAEDIGLLGELTQTLELGIDRWLVPPAAGATSLVPLVLEGMEGSDSPDADAAARAFERMTGFQVPAAPRSGEPAAVTGTEADVTSSDDNEEDEVPRPDVAAAIEAWKRLGGRVSGGARLCRGMDTDRPLDAAAFDRLDMRQRRHLFLRSRFHGSWSGSPLDLERFPLFAGRG